MYYITPFEKKEKERKNRKRFLVKMSSYIISDHNVTHMCSYIGYIHTHTVYIIQQTVYSSCVCVCVVLVHSEVTQFNDTYIVHYFIDLFIVDIR